MSLETGIGQILHGKEHTVLVLLELDGPARINNPVLFIYLKIVRESQSTMLKECLCCG